MELVVRHEVIEVRDTHAATAHDAIVTERASQDAKWGTQDTNSTYRWNAILMEELGEAAEEAEVGETEKYRAEMVQTAAVAVKVIERLQSGQMHAEPEEPIFVYLNLLIREVGMLARAILDSRVTSKTGKQTTGDAIRFATEVAGCVFTVRNKLIDEEEAQANEEDADRE